ncbi:MAG: hypothetical protein JSV39_02220 [Candidatus Aenigmatarchaeota archaeon]|nr:MAG: hypothetical protein JSV39_02220 [Candidatus Aenigmarchaeota archaeon]
MSVKNFFKLLNYKMQVRKILNAMLAEDDLSILTAPEEYKPYEVKKLLEDSKVVFYSDVADILIKEGKTPKDIGSVKLVEGFNEYLIEFAKRKYIGPEKLKKYIGL